MENQQQSLSVSEVTIDRVLSHYLWNTSVPPRREDMQSAATDANRMPINIDATSYMQNGAGRYASAVDFQMFEKFFTEKNLPAKLQPYSFTEIVDLIYHKDDAARVKRLPDSENGFTVPISQYFQDMASSDYTERAFIFGSTQVTVTKADIDKLQFFVRPDGSREIRNLRITPKDDNFDFIGGSSSQDALKMMVDTVNAEFKTAIDPEGIGRTVPLKYTGTEELPFTNITDKDFSRLKEKKAEQKKSDIDLLIRDRGFPLIEETGELFQKLTSSPALYETSPLGRLREIRHNLDDQLREIRRNLDDQLREIRRNLDDQLREIRRNLDEMYEMYQKTRDLIEKDPNMMSLDERNERDQYAADIDKPTALTIEDMPQNAQKIYHQGKQIFADFCAQKNIAYDANSLDNIAMSLASVAYKNKMSGVSLININDNGKVSVGHRAPGLIMASVDMWEAAKTPVEESLSQIQQTAQQIEYEEQQKQIVQSQSHGARIS